MLLDLFIRLCLFVFTNLVVVSCRIRRVHFLLAGRERAGHCRCVFNTQLDGMRHSNDKQISPLHLHLNACSGLVCTNKADGPIRSPRPDVRSGPLNGRCTRRGARHPWSSGHQPSTVQETDRQTDKRDARTTCSGVTKQAAPWCDNVRLGCCLALLGPRAPSTLSTAAAASGRPVQVQEPPKPLPLGYTSFWQVNSTSLRPLDRRPASAARPVNVKSYGEKPCDRPR